MSYQPVQNKPGKQIPALAEYVNYISNFSRVCQRISLVSANTGIVNGTQIQFDIPASALVDTQTLQLKGMLSVKTSAGVAWFPKDITSCIQRIVVETSSMQLDSGCQDTNILTKILLDHSGGNVENQREIMQVGRAWGYTGAAAALPQLAPKEYANAATVGAGNLTNVPFVLTDFMGFLSSQDSYLFTDLLGNLRVTLYLAGPEILQGKDATTQGAFWQWDNLYLSVDTLSVDPSFYQSTQMLLASGSVISKRFAAYHSQRGSPGLAVTQTLTYGLASQSIDMVLATLVRDSTTSTNPVTVTPPLGDSSAYFDRCGNGLVNYQFSINNAYLPLYAADVQFEAWPQLINVLGEMHDLTTTNTHSIRMLSNANRTQLQVWAQGFFCLGLSLNPQVDPSMRAVSGYDSRGSSASIRVILTGQNASFPVLPIIFVKTTPVLKIAANRLHEVIR